MTRFFLVLLNMWCEGGWWSEAHAKIYIKVAINTSSNIEGKNTFLNYKYLFS